MIILSTAIDLFLKIDKQSIVRIRKALENRTNMEDDRVSLLEQQLAQAKLIAEEADKKYEEVGHVSTNKEQWKRDEGPFISLVGGKLPIVRTFNQWYFAFHYLLRM